MPSTPSAIVVLAYGPRRVTADAVERAKRLAGDGTPVVVVPAVGPAARLVGVLASPAVEVVDAVGRDGLLDALGRSGDGPVLLVHDDVLVIDSTFAAMLSTHAATGAITVPWCNDVGQPNSMGTLPPVRKAASAVRAAADSAKQVELHQLRPSCVLGTVGQLRRLADQRVTVARTVLAVHSDEVVAAAGAVVAHDSSCVDQLDRVPADGLVEGRPLLVASMIVRDEEEMLPDCLASLEGLVDRVVVADTGSVDGTVAVAESAGAQVIEVPWRDDFGWARNQALAESRDGWFVLQVDADERVVCDDPAELRRLLATDRFDCEAFTVQIDNVGDGGRVQTTHDAIRLFRPEGIEFRGALHEAPARTDGARPTTARLAGMTLRHYGYTKRMLGGRGKVARNTEISRQQFTDAPSAVSALNYARSLNSHGDPNEVIALLAEAKSMGLPAAAHAYACGLQALQHLKSGEDEQALELAKAGLDRAPADDTVGRAHAEAALAVGVWSDVISVAAWRRKAPSPTPYSSSRVARDYEMLAVARAHIASDDLDAATQVAVAVAEGGWVSDADAWLDIVSILSLADPDNAVERLIPAAQLDGSGNAVKAVAKVFGGRMAAALAGDAVARGGRLPATIKTGLTCAIVSGHTEAAQVLAEHVLLVDADAADRLMAAAASRGQTEVSAALAKALLATG